MSFTTTVFVFTCMVITLVTSKSILSGESCGPNAVKNSDCGSSNKKTSYLVGTEKVGWFQAFLLCKNGGMELASISSPEEEVALENHTRTIATNVGPYEGYWLAGTRHGFGYLVWFTTGKPMIYRNFAAGQPDNAGGNESCIELFLNTTDVFAWNDIGCDQKLGYICQSISC